MALARTPQQQALLAAEVTRGSYFFLELMARNRGPVQVALGGRETCGEHYHVERAGYPFPTLEFVAEGVGQICYEEGSPITVGFCLFHGQRSSGGDWKTRGGFRPRADADALRGTAGRV